MVTYITNIPRNNILYLDLIVSEYHNTTSITRYDDNISKYDFYYLCVEARGLCYSDMNYLSEHIGEHIERAKITDYVDWLQERDLIYKLDSLKMGVL